MAKVRLFNNIFEDKFDEYDIKSGDDILSSLEEHINKDVYKESLVECYDSETGETFFAAIDDEESESVLISVNGKVVDSSYVPEENDLITVAFLPAGADSQGATTGTILGVIGGAILGIAYVASTFVTFGASAPLGMLIFAGIFGAAVGGIIGYNAGAMYDQMKQQQQAKKQLGLKEGSQCPDVRGASNTSLRGNNYPFVFGKHLITPFVVGDPYTSYGGTRGRDAYIRVMLCAGYAPLKLTDFKLGEFMLAYNRSHGSVTANTMISGMLQGYGDGDSGDILNIWKNNDVKVEILQQPNSGAIDYGTIYPEAVDDQEINANVLFVADKEITDLAAVVYKGTSFPNNFRTNGVFFSASCPRQVTVTIDFPNGLYSTYTKTEGNTSQSLYGDIPYWVCAQWRPYNKNNETSKSDGSDYNSWYNLDFGYTALFDNDAAKADVIAHRGNNFSSYYQSKVEEQQWVTRIRYSGEYNQYEENYQSLETVVTQAEMENLAPLYGSFLGKNLQNFQSLTGGTEGMSQTRVTATINLTLEQCQQMLSDDNPTRSIEIRVLRVSPCYLNMTHNVDEKTGAYNFSDMMQVKAITTKRFDADTLRLSGQVVPVKVQSEADMRKFCYIAIEAKADASGYIINQLQKVNCMAESFSPYWDLTTKKLMPEGVHKETRYYGYYDANNHKCNRNKNAREVLVTKTEYETARHEGYNWYEEKAGSNFTFIMKNIVFTTPVSHFDRNCYYLPASAEPYNNNCVSSSFLLASVGPQSGSEACGYEDLNIISLADWAEKTDALIDGTTFPVATVYRGHSYAKGDLVPVHYEANGYIYSGVKFEDLLSKIATCGRAMWIIDESGKIKIIMDCQADYIKGAISANDCESSSNTFTFDSMPAGLMVSFADENDGYEQNSIYCWSEGNSEKNYHGNVEPFNIDYVTSPYQISSLGCYMLACRVLNKEVLTRKIGPEGELYSIGDVILVQSDELLIGEVSGTVQELIEVDGIIYGFVMDSEYDYLAETGTGGNSTQGVTVIQPNYLGNSRVITIPISMPRTVPIDEVIKDGETVITTIHHEYTLKKGRTNVVLFGLINGSYGVRRDTSDASSTVAIKYNMHTGNTCLLGLIDKTAAPYRITKIKPEKGGKFTETLVPYNEGLYNAGTEMPTFQNYMTAPQIEDTRFALTETPTKLNDLNNQTTDSLNKVGFLKDETQPAPPYDISIVATVDKLAFTWSVYDPTKIKHTVIEYSSDNGETWEVVGTTDARNWNYYFVRSKDGYPERNELESRLYRLKNVSIFDISSGYEYGTVVTSDYGTWQPATPNFVSKIPSENNIHFKWNEASGGGKTLYGTIKFELEIYYNEQLVQTIVINGSEYIYSFNRNVDGYPEKNHDSEHRGLDLYTFGLKVFNEAKSATTTGYFLQEELNNYKTWIIPPLVINKEVVDRTIILTAVYGGSNAIYGRLKTLVRIKRLGNTDPVTDDPEYTFNTILGIAPDTDYAKPDFERSVVTSSNPDNEPHYKKDNDPNAYETSNNKITHTLPLIGQTARIYRDGNIPILENGTCVEDVVFTATIPETPEEGEVIYLTGEVEGFVTGGYYLYSNSEWTRIFSKFTKDVEDYSTIPSSPNKGDVIHFTGREEGYVEGAYYYYNGEEWENVKSKSLIVPTAYIYEIGMTNESGSVSYAEPVTAIALSTNISDVVHSHEHYKDLYVEKLSAINANLGMISQGGMGTFDKDKGNYWALSDLSPEDTGIIGGIKKGSFRVGGDDQYFKVEPSEEDPNKFHIELRAGSINLTTEAEKDGFINGTYIYEGEPETSTMRLALTSGGIIVQRKINNEWIYVSKFLGDKYGNLVMSNSDSPYSYGFMVEGSIYHFDTVANQDENGVNSQSITCDGEIISTENTEPILEFTNSPKCFSGVIEKNSSFSGTVVAFSKSNFVYCDDNYISPIGSVNLGYNSYMKQPLEDGTIGSLLGLSNSQISNGIFKYI